MVSTYHIGIDEVGRGPLAGPLCVGACLVRSGKRRSALSALRGVRDSKRLTSVQRQEWLSRMKHEVQRGTLAFTTAFVAHSVIDRKGLAYAIRIAIQRSLRKLSVSPSRSRVLLDGGLHAPAEYAFQKTIIRGDESEPLIALASIAAKVRRDRYMVRLARRYPFYGFEVHKGYGTRSHYAALRKHGVSAIHRRSFLSDFSVTNA